jgi:uncharacterized protein YkwD
MFRRISVIFTLAFWGLAGCSGLPYQSAESLATLAAQYNIAVTIEGLITPVSVFTQAVEFPSVTSVIIIVTNTATPPVEEGAAQSEGTLVSTGDDHSATQAVSGDTEAQVATSTNFGNSPPSATPIPLNPGTTAIAPTATSQPATSVPQPTNTPNPSNTSIPPSTTSAPTQVQNTAIPTNTSAPSGGGGCSPVTNAAIESQIISLINGERAKQSLGPLGTNNKLTSAGRVHSKDMACNGFFDHTSPTTGTPFNRIAAQGYSYSWAGENIAAGYSTAAAVVSGWMDSSGHRANILHANYTEIGVGYASLDGSPYGQYYTAVFGAP